ncbi:serine/threonine protein phosphatase 1 [Devosia sp. YR412]|uniref:metallophosphoesterase family protein n=1 Tax=Devosia sp. YR412 TaxID=1881030 RepID=UPI0008AFB25E|nr:metallophosphoesterase family protein [Devosia sp. YR412]SEP95403.1 serine/threonine protein phosphatase 1 [Devosia sp. YR412]
MWNLFRREVAAPTLAARRLARGQRPELVYAIGDVHGCLDDLKRLEARIVADAAATPGTKLIVMLGDYVDRGPKSAQTLDWLQRPAPDGFERICLRGNHEMLFRDAFARPDKCNDWLAWGGQETLASYGIAPQGFVQASGRLRKQMLQSLVPNEHWHFLDQLPIMLDLPGFLLVHAGIRPGIALDEQADEDLIWIREPFLSQPHGLDKVVVHGHTPADQPSFEPYRVGIDTRAYGGGKLTALRIASTGEFALLTS